MSELLESVNKRDFDRRISEVVEMLEEKQLYGTISLIKDLKYYLDLVTKEKAHTCNCQHNGNSRDNEPCCRCNGKRTHADRIRNMSDEELAEWINTKDTCGQCAYELESLCMEGPCTNGILKWLQSETEVEESEEK